MIKYWYKRIQTKITYNMRTSQTFNEWLAVKITNGVATMWCAYAFAGVALIALPQALYDTFDNGFFPLPLVSWVSQCFIQLVMLSIIMVGQKVLAEHHERSHRMSDEQTQKLDAIIKRLEEHERT